MKKMNVWVAVAAMVVACNPDSTEEPLETETPQAISAADAVGTNATGFFPIGMWFEGTFAHTGYYGAAPHDSVDSIAYYDETFRQLKALGLNTVVEIGEGISSGLTTSEGYCHVDDALSAAERVGGLYIVYASSPVAALDYGSGVADEAGALSVTNTLVSRFSSRPGLLDYYTTDEPTTNAFATMRAVDKDLAYYETLAARPLHDHTMSALTSGAPNTYPPTADEDRAVGSSVMTTDEFYPLQNKTPIGDTTALELWGDQVSHDYFSIPTDKSLYEVIQAHHWGDNAHPLDALRDPTPQELRYMTYAALARGVKGVFWFMYQTEVDSQTASRMGGIADLDFNLDAGGQEIRKLTAEIRTLAPWLYDARRDDWAGTTAIATLQTIDGGTGFDGNDYDLIPFRTTSNEEMLMLVNERMRPVDPATHTYNVQLNAASTQLQTIFAKGGVTFVDALSNTSVGSCAALAGCSFSTTLAQGDGKLYRVASALSADTRLRRDSYANPVNAGKSVTAAVTLTNTGTTTWTPTSHHVGVHVLAPNGTVITQATGVTGADFGASVSPGATVTLAITIPTGTGTSLVGNGVFALTFDVYATGTPNLWFGNGARIAIMVAPGPLFVDTFDNLPFNTPTSVFYKWERNDSLHAAPPTSIRGDALAVNGSGARAATDSNAFLTAVGQTWTDYTLELDVEIDPESAVQYAGWVARAANTNSAYVFRLASTNAIPNANNIVKYTRSGTTLTAQGTIATGLTITPGVWYHVKQELSGTTIKTYIKPRDAAGAPVLVDTWTTSTFTTGRVGIWLNEDATSSLAYNRERAHYDNFFVYTTTLDSTAPAQVLGVTATASGLAAQVGWNRDTSVAGMKVSHYRLYRSTTSGFTPGPTNLIASPAGTVFLDTGVTAGTTYYYKVVAVSHADVAGTASSQASVVAPGTPTTITGLAATATNMKSVGLAWSGSAPKFNIHRGPAGFTPSELNRIATVTTTSYNDAIQNTFVAGSALGPEPFKSYTYAVVPVTAAGALGSAATTSITMPGSKLFSDGFDAGAGAWTAYAGTWAVSGSKYNQTTTSCGSGCSLAAMSAITARKWGDLVAEFTVQINSYGTNPANWAGMTIRKTSQADGLAVSGYIVYYRANGFIELLQASGGVVLAAVDTKLLPTTQPRRVRIEANGLFLRVLVDDTVFINYWWLYSVTNGYVDLTTYGASASFSDVSIHYHDSFNRLSTFFGSANWLLTPGGADYDTTEIDAMKLNPPSGFLWTATPKSTTAGDFTADLSLRVENASDPTAWGAFSFRKVYESDNAFTSGYTVYLRANRELNLYSAATGNVVTGVVLPSCPSTASCPASACYRQIRVWALGNRIRVYADGVQIFDWTDPASQYGVGSFGLASYGAATRFESFTVF